MFALLQSCIFVLLVGNICCADKPSIDPIGPEVEINAGEQLLVTCRGLQEMKIIHPPPSARAGIETSVAIVEESKIGENSFKYKLRKAVAVVGDTGYYGCANDDIEVNPNQHNQSDVSWIYIYVRSNVNLFVVTDMFPTTLSAQAEEGSTLVIPCRPTSPMSYLVKLTCHSHRELSRSFYFDPKIGFYKPNVTRKYNSIYSCRIEHNNLTQSTYYNAVVI